MGKKKTYPIGFANRSVGDVVVTYIPCTLCHWRKIIWSSSSSSSNAVDVVEVAKADDVEKDHDNDEERNNNIRILRREGKFNVCVGLFG